MEYNTEDLELVDPEVLERYSLSRIKEWLSPPRPIFGKFREIHVSQFVKEIDSAHPHTPIIIHLFHRSHAACILLNQHFTLLAKKYKLAHFLRLVAKDADPEFDPIAFPTVQVYKNGRLICNLIRVTMELAREDEVWELYDCELMLRKHGALTDSDFSSGISANSDDSDSNT
ncbi:Phosducin-like protein 2 [Coelomomyces lativittatus]|nr:Phosducin-like protein 2 [Coelomomyces lativittatus]